MPLVASQRRRLLTPGSNLDRKRFPDGLEPVVALPDGLEEGEENGDLGTTHALECGHSPDSFSQTAGPDVRPVFGGQVDDPGVMSMDESSGTPLFLLVPLALPDVGGLIVALLDGRWIWPLSATPHRGIVPVQ